LNFLRSLIKLTIKIIFLVLLVNNVNFCQQDSLQTDNRKNDSVFVMTKSPWGAVLRSAVVPGLGQIYNESYWKAPLVWGIAGWLIYNWIDNNRLYKQNKEDYKTAYNSGTGSTQTLSIYKTNRDFYRDQRDLFSIYMGLTYVLTLVDAYVDAHMFDFTVDENFLRQPMLGIKFNF
jgi:hypothetical protein